jgi:hypothetical protein
LTSDEEFLAVEREMAELLQQVLEFIEREAGEPQAGNARLAATTNAA